MASPREFDLVLIGATGFTGRLVAEHLLARHGADGSLRWALAGRNREKLAQVRESLGPGADALPLVVADSHDRPSLDALATSTRVVCSTVGPYALHGAELVAACAAAGTDYCDLTGEVPWMRRMLDAHAESAARSGARLVHCCGFDSIPSDLGVAFLQEQAATRLGAPLTRVRMRVKALRGGLSGGTAASMLQIMEESRRDPEIKRILANPYALCPPEHRRGVHQPYVAGPAFDPVFRAWSAPFVMAAINTRIVHRSNALAGSAYGPEFRYDEAMLTGRGLRGRTRAITLSLGLGAFAAGAALGPTRALIRRWMLPAPGDGPDAEKRASGLFDLRFHGVTADGRELTARVTGDRDPGYGSTSKMLGEAAVCLARDLAPGEPAGGFWTPATALGTRLRERLVRHAGLTFEILD